MNWFVLYKQCLFMQNCKNDAIFLSFANTMRVMKIFRWFKILYTPTIYHFRALKFLFEEVKGLFIAIWAYF